MKSSRSVQSDIAKWSNISRKWINYLPPFRPSASDIETFRKQILSAELGREAKALVLGATPELRDLLFELQLPVTLVDHNPKMIEEMGHLRIYNNDETIVVSDWFDFLRNQSKSFELIVSDLTQGNIPFTSLADFYKLLAEAMMPQGIFIDRLFAFRDLTKLFVARDEVKRFTKTPVVNLALLNEFFYKCFCASDLLFTHGQVDIGKFCSILRQDSDDSVVAKFTGLLTEYLANETAIWYSGKKWVEILPIYSQSLRIIDEISDSEPEFRSFPTIVVSRPK